MIVKGRIHYTWEKDEEKAYDEAKKMAAMWFLQERLKEKHFKTNIVRTNKGFRRIN